MRRNFTIRMGIYLVQPPHELDLHNFYNFQELSYSVAQRTLLLVWRRSERAGVSTSLPSSSTIEFSGVTEFRFLPRDSGLPFTEDDCLRNFGYWTDEAWAEGSVMICNESKVIAPLGLNAVEFMSGAIIVVQADFAHATIVA